MQRNFRSQSSFTVSKLQSNIQSSMLSQTKQQMLDQQKRSQSAKTKSDQYTKMLKLQQKREEGFDISRTTLNITKKSYDTKILEDQYKMKNMFIPNPVRISSSQAPSFRKEKQSYYDSRQKEFEVIKQYNKYDQLLKSQLDQRQVSSLKRCDFLSRWRSKDNNITEATFEANLMRFSGFSYSPIKRNTRVEDKPLFATQTIKEKEIRMNKSMLRSMELSRK